MSLPALKVAACFIGLASCTGLGILISNSPFFPKEKKISTPKVRDLLRDKGYSVMKSESSGWNTLLSAYKEGKNSDIVKFGSSSNISEEDLKRECASALEDILTSSYEKAKRWCVEPKKVSDKLKDVGLTPLKTEGVSGQDDSENWKKLEKEYVKEGSEKIEGSNISQTTNDTSWQGLRDACKKLFESNPWDDSYDSSLKLSKKWCVSQAVPANN
ncbi:hypothetical protein MHC_02830 [Mycoplasma haemocanis str. Illinois]|uniref:Lipoprotein n=1 Tax=Mycoplasma haemocanis (strain Illinois) TaxID=1111676 RepID=H6N706_MYCHN|nr:hypothetical protein [Mycoplasma haemocanis]AEW45428.1 hypothetical protein MHC_02830 [Mycoplasma haemocanis str. Illinois]